MNHPGRDFTGEYVVLDKRIMASDHIGIEWRVVKVVGGFGCVPNAIGRAIYVQYHDGDQGCIGIGGIERFATASEIHDYAHRTRPRLCVLGDACTWEEDQ